MTIQRSGPTPPFYEYICNYLLVPNTSAPSPQVQQLLIPGQQAIWVDIPRFQRGISWDVDNVQELLRSTSILLGNAILSQLARTPGQFPHLPQSQSNFHLLIDGLQRFAVGTALLSILHDLVLVPAPSRLGEAPSFAPLAARVYSLSAFYIHNDRELRNHPRRAIQDQYKTLRESLEKYVNDEFTAGNGTVLANLIVTTFLSRQLAIDIYFNFQRNEILNTFIGINTVRVDLGPVDLLRAHILEKAAGGAWSELDVELIENSFTETMTDDQKPKQYLLPFVNASVKLLDQGHGERLFPTWKTGLLKQDVEKFIDFIESFEQVIGTTYVNEIYLCGNLPASILVAHYYMDFLHGSQARPAFFKGGTACDAELHHFLISCYRLVLGGGVGRTGDYLEKILSGALIVPLSSLADSISISFVGRGISAPLDVQWLETNLNSVDKRKAPRIFNAMLLPDKSNMGGAYAPLAFGRSAANFHIDHLIPDSLLVENKLGFAEGNTLRNFAPLPMNQNRVAKATSCSSKLGANGIYSTYIGGGTHPVHPYCNWLVQHHAPNFQSPSLDRQENLEKNVTGDVSTSRIQKIRDELNTRI